MRSGATKSRHCMWHGYLLPRQLPAWPGAWPTGHRGTLVASLVDSRAPLVVARLKELEVGILVRQGLILKY